MKRKEIRKSVKELEIISGVLNDSKNRGLVVEILWSAFYYLKEFPDDSIEKAINFGINEWIK